jgi:transposase
MYFRSSIRRNPKTGELSGYYRLVESYRDMNGRVCHRTMVTAGFLDELSPDHLNQIQNGLNLRVEGLDNQLFPGNTDPLASAYIDRFYQQMVKEKRIDVLPKPTSNKDWQTIDLNSLRNKDVREIGAEWLCYQAISQLRIDKFLESKGWESEKTSLALTHLVSRAVYPASEYKTSSWIRENSAVCEITGYDVKKITKDRLYQISHSLYAEKDSLEQYLSRQTNELFDLQDKIILYDLTNTYFEGEKRHSRIARFGRSKEKRNDARLVVMAVVINPEGFIKYSTIYEGNKADCKTLVDMIEKLRQATSLTGERALVVIDAGIATDDNLKLIQAKGYDYLCVSRSTVKNYTVEAGDSCVTITDKKKQKIELRNVKVNHNTDYYLHVKSESKGHKESAMNSRFKDRFDEGLVKIESSLHKKGGVKQLAKVHQRIGRLKQKYPSIHRFYQIDVESDDNNIVTSLTWSINPATDPDENSGIYFLRTSLTGLDEALVWMIYNTIREIEYTFRVLKTDLDLRPIFHQNDDSTMAHLYLGLLAYWIVNTVRYQLKQKEITSSWREIVRVMNTQKCVTTVAQNNKDEIISIRRCSEPDPKAQQIYDALKYKHAPFVRKKSVVLKPESEKIQLTQNKVVIRI